MTETKPVITVQDVLKTYGRGVNAVNALQGVSLKVDTGSCMAVVGESGSGKTTLARIIVGLEHADSGRVEVAGQEIKNSNNRHNLRSRAAEMQLVFQDPLSSLNRRLSVQTAILEVLQTHTTLTAKQRNLRVEQLFAQVGLSTEHLRAYPAQLSGGQCQRVVIARALAAEPSVIVFDESVAALDVTVQSQILELLDKLRKSRGLTYLFITHDLSVVQQIADNIIVMRHGKIVEVGVTRDVLRHPEHPYTRLLLECVPRPGWCPQLGSIEQMRREIGV